MNAREVQRAIDKGFAQLEFTSGFQCEALSVMKGEKVVKRKISVAFVLAIVLVMLVATAVALTLMNAYYEKTIEMEATHGLFKDWEVSDKIAFVNMMVDAGIKLDDAGVEQLSNGDLSEEEADEIASKLVEGYYGPWRGGALTILDIMATEKRPYENWSLEDRAWVTEMQQKYGDEKLGSLYSINMLPDEGAGDIGQEEAMRIAYEVLTNKYAVTDEQLDAMECEMRFVDLQEGVFTRDNGELESGNIWSFVFFPSGTFDEYTVDLYSDGTYRSSSEPQPRRPARTLNDELSDLVYEEDFWTPRNLAQYVKVYGPQIREEIERGGEITSLFRYLAEIPYALPSNDAIPENNALHIARQAIIEVAGWSEDQLNLYKPWPSYRIYDENSPEWRFGFTIADAMDYQKFHSGEIPFGIVVRVDAETGEILSVKETEDRGLYNDFGEFPDERDSFTSTNLGVG